MKISGFLRKCNYLQGEYFSTTSLLGTELPGESKKNSYPADSNYIKLFRGDSVKCEVTVKDEWGNPVDLTGALARFTVKRETYCGEHVYQARTDQDPDEITITNPTEGVMEITVPYTDTEEWETGWPYYYDIEVTQNPNTPEAYRQTIVRDRMEILADITTS